MDKKRQVFRLVFFGCSCQARTDDNFGQKHCHLASSINLLARFCVSSDNRPPFFRHWRRSGSVQLTASAVNLVQTTIGTKRTKKKARTPFGVRAFLAAPVRLELTTTRLTAECSTDWAKEQYILVFAGFLWLFNSGFPLLLNICKKRGRFPLLFAFD